MPNRIVALINYLKADSTVSNMVGARVFADELPDNQVPRMPRACLVLTPSGGGTMGGGYMDISDQRVDVRHYAWTPASAYDLFTATYAVLNNLRRVGVGDTLLHWCRPAGGPVQMRDPGPPWPGGVPDNSTHWPFVQATWQVLAADIPVPEVVTP